MQHAKAGEAVDPGGRAAARITPSPQGRRWLPETVTLNRLGLATGLWLFLFAATHLANHALGLVSLAAAEAGRQVFLAVWRLPPIEASLLVALLLHAALGLAKLWQRRTLRVFLAEAAQLAFALLIPGDLTGPMPSGPVGSTAAARLSNATPNSERAAGQRAPRRHRPRGQPAADGDPARRRL